MKPRELVKNYRGKEGFMVKLLLDTTYLLPVFGVSVKLKRFDEVFPRLINEYSLLYNPVSIIEAKWLIVSQSRRNPSKREILLKRFRKGLRTLLNDKRISQTDLTNPEIEEIADNLLVRFKIRDYFDRMIYATAVYYNVTLLTEDEELHGLAGKEYAPKPKKILKWNDMLR